MSEGDRWTPERIQREVAYFRALERRRPEVIQRPSAGQESVWDYPRPPRVEPELREVRIVLAGTLLVQSRRAVRVLETASPPGIYVPVEDVRPGALGRTEERTLCEWKGLAVYWRARVGNDSPVAIAWSYPEPFGRYESLRGRISFYPARVDECWLGGERVRAQPGDYYGGWVTREIVGPFKGSPGSEGW